MRLPADAALIVVGPGGAEPIGALLGAWRAENLPIVNIPEPLAADALEARLDPFGATTLVICGGASPAIEAVLRTAASLGYRLFVVAEACPEPASLAGKLAGLARFVSLPTALEAAGMARFRQKGRAARAAAG